MSAISPEIFPEVFQVFLIRQYLHEPIGGLSSSLYSGSCSTHLDGIVEDIQGNILLKRGSVGVDKIVRIVLSSLGPMSPYIHEVLR